MRFKKSVRDKIVIVWRCSKTEDVTKRMRRIEKSILLAFKLFVGLCRTMKREVVNVKAG